jgi:hypothetical protein
LRWKALFSNSKIIAQHKGGDRMAKYLVTSDFIDKHTQIYYAAGSIYETSSKERAAELHDMGFVGDEIKPQRKGRASDEHSEAPASGDAST